MSAHTQSPYTATAVRSQVPIAWVRETANLQMSDQPSDGYMDPVMNDISANDEVVEHVDHKVCAELTRVIESSNASESDNRLHHVFAMTTRLQRATTPTTTQTDHLAGETAGHSDAVTVDVNPSPGPQHGIANTFGDDTAFTPEVRNESDEVSVELGLT